MKQKIIYGLISSIFIAANATTPVFADETTDLLVKQVQELQKTVGDLKQELNSVKSQSPKSTESVSKEVTENSEKTATVEDVNGIKTDLENFKYQYNREREYNTAQTTRPLNISGFVQLRGQIDSQKNGNNLTPQSVNNNNRKNTFNNGSAALQFSGNLFKDYEDGKNLSYLLRVAANPSTPAGVNPTGNNSSINLQFASLSYNFRPTLNPEDSRLAVTVGQQLVPFGLDSAATDELKPTILGAQLAAQTPNIDIGALVRGEVKVNYDYGYSYRAPELVYYAGVFNGAGINNTDNNGYKNYFGRLVYTVPAEYNSWLRQLAFGVSGLKGKSSLVDPLGAFTNGKQDRLGFDVYYNHDPFGITYEYVRSWDEKFLGTTLATKRDVQGEDHVLTAYYNIGQQFLYNQSALGTPSVATGRFDDWWPKSWQVFARYDHYDPDTNDDTKSFAAANRLYGQNISTLGVNAFFAQTTKFQLNYNHYDRKLPGANSDDQLLAQFQYSF
jgi:hypothetical protein